MIKHSDNITRLRAFQAAGAELASETLEIRKEVRKYNEKGKRAYEMMSADVPSGGLRNIALNEILSQVAKEGYGSSYGAKIHYNKLFNEAAVHYQKEFFDVEYDPKTDIIITNSVGSAMPFIDFCFTNPGDMYISEDPSHITSHDLGWKAYGAEVQTFPLIEENMWAPDIDKLRDIPITKKTKAIAIVHPHNPTGRIHPEKALKSIVDFAGENDLFIISDEIYCDTIHNGAEYKSLPKIAKEVPVLVLHSFSKFLMNPGWGIGYIAIHDTEGKIKDILMTGKAHRRLLRSSQPIVGAAAIGMMQCRKDFNKYHETLGPEGKKTSVMYHSLNLMKHIEKTTEYIVKRVNEIEGLSVVKANATFYMMIKTILIHFSANRLYAFCLAFCFLGCVDFECRY